MTTITHIQTYNAAPTVPETIAFNDGAVIRQSGGLICSQHGRRHCRHHKLAHNAIIAAAEHAAATIDSDTAPLQRQFAATFAAIDAARAASIAANQAFEELMSVLRSQQQQMQSLIGELTALTSEVKR
jgi:hypothetical protein